MQDSFTSVEPNIKNDYRAYLADGGEMGTLTRSHDWSKTSLGSPDQWPQNLLSAVSIILHSKFPMFLWWGEDMVQFYNDAYRPSLGNNGKHPHALGQNGRECWPEIWDIIYPLIVHVQTTGESTWMEDQLVPIYRNGKIEDVYWTYSYSAVLDDDGKPSGILVTCVETTEKVIAIKKLKEAEEKARLAIDSAELGVYEIVLDTNEITTNEKFNHIWGFDKPASRTEYAAAIHPSDIAVREQAHQSSLATGHLQYQVRVIQKDKSVHWVRVQGKVIFNDKHKPVKLIGVIQDVTEQVLSQKKIEESEKSFRNMILQAPVAMCILSGPQHVVEIANTKMFELWGKEEYEVMHKPIFDGLPEAREQGIEILLHNVFTTGERFVANERPVNLPRNKKIETVYINFVYEALRQGDGTISGVLAVAIDVTPQVLSRREVEVAEERARLAISSAELGVYEVDLQTKVVVTDDRYNDIFGIDDGASWDELIKVIHPDDLPIRNQAHLDALESGIIDYEARIIKKNCSLCWIRAKGKVLYTENGEATKLLGVVQDITEQKQFAEALERKVQERTLELAEANMQLQQSNVELNQFAYIASHDLQEPLRKVRTFTQMMEASMGEVNERTKTYISKIQSSTERMQTLINDVLKFSLLSKEREKFETIDLNIILQNIVNDYELSIEQKSAKIITDALPVIEAIPLQMSQLFTNLLSNALKFTSDKRTPEIIISAREATTEEVKQHRELDANKPYYLITFKDNGIGFSQEHAQQIFTIFQRLHGRMEFEGTGIGLAMCKKIVSNHHGVIYATSNLDEGASFIVILAKVQ